MALITFKPTSAGRRQMVRVSTPGLHKGGPLAALTESQGKTGGRNNHGRITTRHKGGGHKQNYRIIDFKRDKEGIACRVERLEYDPNRTARIALLVYADGEKRYIVAPLNLQVGDKVMSGPTADIRPGNALPLRNIPLGTMVHNIELQPGKGGQMVRSAGTSAQLLARDHELYATVRLPSGEERYVRHECLATIGQVGNVEHGNVKLGKAGRKRHLGIRPAVRGSAMTPRDHPHGGGEGRSPIGMAGPKTPWGKPAQGRRTRNNKSTDKFIFRRRAKKRR